MRSKAGGGGDAEVIVPPGGIPVVIQTADTTPSVSVGVWIRTGARHEPARHAGIAHFTEHLIFKGTRRYSARGLAEAIDGVGGSLNAFTSREYTAVTCQVLSAHLPLAFEVIGEMIRKATLPAAEVERERNVVLEEIRLYEDTPDDLVHDRFNAAAWGGDGGLGWSILGTAQSLARTHRAQVAAYYRRAFHPANLFVSVAGACDREQVLKLVAGLGLTRGGKPQPPTPTGRFAPRRVRIKKDVEQTHLCLGWRGVPWADPRRHALQVLATTLGGGMSSRLFQEVREKRGLAYSVFTYLNSYRSEGTVVNCAGSAPDNLKKVVGCFLTEAQRLMDRPIPPRELRRVKEQIKGHFVLGLESNNARMNFNAVHYYYLGRPPVLNELLARLEAVGAAEVQHLARQLFAPPPAVVTIGPEADDRLLAEALRGR